MTGPLSNPRARTQRVEMLIGILGFFDLAAFIAAVVSLVRGQSMLHPMIVLVGFTVLLVTVVRIRQRM